MSTQAIPMNEFIKGNLEYFAPLEEKADTELTRLSRELPAGYYENVREKLFEFLILGGLSGKITIKAVIDSNIIVSDALRIANGNSSTTERILSSKFIKFIAPPDLRIEVERNIREHMTDASKCKIALNHAENLISHIQVVPVKSESIINRARLILSHHPKDIPFLAMYFESEADAIITREKGTFDREEVCRWDLRKAVETVVSYESGSLAFIIAGAAIDVLLELFQSILLTILTAICEGIGIIVNFLKDLATGIVNAISKLPDWAKIAIAIICGVGIIAIMLDEGLRNQLVDGLKKIGETLHAIVNTIINAIKEMLILVWNVTLPLTSTAVIIGGVLLRRILSLIQLSQSLAQKTYRY